MINLKKKAIILLAFATIASNMLSFAAQENDESLTRSLLDKVEVKRIQIDLNSTPKNIKDPLSTYIAYNSHHEQFQAINNHNWYSKWLLYKNKLIEIAKKEGFDVESLKKCLNKIEPKEDNDTALLPISAYLAKKGEADIWIISCVWGYADVIEKDGKIFYLRLGHIRVWAFTKDNIEQVGFTTCT